MINYATTVRPASAAKQLWPVLSEAPLHTETDAIRITASFGVTHTLGAGDTLDSPLRDADTALYDAKRNGRNAVSLVAAAVGINSGRLFGAACSICSSLEKNQRETLISQGFSLVFFLLRLPDGHRNL